MKLLRLFFFPSSYITHPFSSFWFLYGSSPCERWLLFSILFTSPSFLPSKFIEEASRRSAINNFFWAEQSFSALLENESLSVYLCPGDQSISKFHHKQAEIVGDPISLRVLRPHTGQDWGCLLALPGVNCIEPLYKGSGWWDSRGSLV